MFTSTESMENNGVGSHVLPYTTSDENLNIRIAEFKSDSNNMLVVSEFIDKVLQQAEFEVNRYNNANTKGSGQVHREEVYYHYHYYHSFKNALIFFYFFFCYRIRIRSLMLIP